MWTFPWMWICERNVSVTSYSNALSTGKVSVTSVLLLRFYAGISWALKGSHFEPLNRKRLNSFRSLREWNRLQLAFLCDRFM